MSVHDCAVAIGNKYTHRAVAVVVRCNADILPVGCNALMDRWARVANDQGVHLRIVDDEVRESV